MIDNRRILSDYAALYYKGGYGEDQTIDLLRNQNSGIPEVELVRTVRRTYFILSRKTLRPGMHPRI